MKTLQRNTAEVIVPLSSLWGQRSIRLRLDQPVVPIFQAIDDVEIL